MSWPHNKSDETKQQRISDLREHAANGLTMKMAAEEMSLGYIAVTKIARSAGIKFVRSLPRGTRKDFRADKMREMWVAGDSLEEISSQFSISRERVRQILFDAFGKIEGGVKRLRDELRKLDRPVIQSLPPTYVYIIEANNGLVKIGNSAQPFARAQCINLNSPIPCRLIAVWKGRKKDEMALHSRFDEHRRHNEWFVNEGSLADWVEEVRGEGLAEPIQTWANIIFPNRNSSRVEAGRKRSAKLKEKWADPEYRSEQKRRRLMYRRWDRERFDQLDLPRVTGIPRTALRPDIFGPAPAKEAAA